jgi:DNA-binding HxlR family transcriptional regulator
LEEVLAVSLLSDGPAMECSPEPNTHERAESTLSVLGEKWTIPLLHQIVQGNNRFWQLQRAMPGISPKTLMVRLRELEEAGILSRNVFPGYPLHVEYAATERGKALGKAILAMDDWGEQAAEHPAH